MTPIPEIDLKATAENARKAALAEQEKNIQRAIQSLYEEIAKIERAIGNYQKDIAERKAKLAKIATGDWSAL